MKKNTNIKNKILTQQMVIMMLGVGSSVFHLLTSVSRFQNKKLENNKTLTEKTHPLCQNINSKP